ncbi:MULTISPECIES: ATP-binding cassette domain-containing protein [unclassified Microbacterium]|uniref:ATP-binding cassette domain-containing protein n=1 Tax=unclassified Microbacterium TaxID=2609290 RepID=UPI00141A9D9A|nr:ATP-binding cassette domain-containing protein [Microbacterium sp. 3H14]
MRDEGPAVVLQGVGHGWSDGPPLFDGISATLQRGDVTALTGPSGSGKSTLLSIIAGWLTPTRGNVQRIKIDRTHWVFQNPYGQPRRTTLDHVSYPFLARGLARTAADRESMGLLVRFGLEDRGDRPFADLSGGEAQRLMLARAVATRPDLLLVDEPTAQLDRVAARTVNDVLAGLADAGAIVLVASHDADTVRACKGSIDLGSVR